MECAWNFVIHALRNADNVQYQYALWHMLHTAIFVSVFVACHRNPCRTMDACKNRHHRLLASSLLLLPYVNGWCSSFQFSSAHYAKRNQSCRRRKQHRVIVPLLSFVLHFANQKTTFSALEKNQKNFLISQKYIYGNILHYFSDCMTDLYPNHAYHSDRRKDVASNKNTNFCPFHSRSFCDRLWVFVPILRNSIFCCLYLPTFRIFHAYSIFYGYENAAFHNIKIMYDGLF